MRSRYVLYYVEGDDEKKLINTLKNEMGLIKPGKVQKLNVIEAIYNQDIYLLGGSHVDMNDPAKSMQEVAEKFHKDYGVRVKHMIVAFSKNDGVSSSMAYAEAEEISEKIGRVFQNVYGVHVGYPPHIHFAINTVNHINGYKFDRNDKKRVIEIVEEAMEELELDDFRVIGK